MRDLPTIAFFRAVALLRRHGPVPGILAARRPGAIMDKSGPPRLITFHARKQQKFPLKKDPKNVTLKPKSVTDVLNQKCYRRLSRSGSRITDHGLRITVYGSRITDHGLRITVYG